MLFYRAALPLSHQTLTYVAGIIRRHRAAIGSLWHTPGSVHPANARTPSSRPGASSASSAAAPGAPGSSPKPSTFC